MKRQQGTSSKSELWRDTMTTMVTAPSLVKETRNAPTTGINGACSDRRSRKNKCDNSML